jgi:hypothetical protein
MTDWTQFAVESRVELVAWARSEWVDDNQFVPPGTQGTVFGHGVDQLWVRWDNGSTLSPNGTDRVRAVSA